MTDDAAPGVATASRLDRLLPLLEADPENLSLLSDAAETALAEQRPEIAAALLDRYAEAAPLPEMERNLAGLAAMQLKRFDRAADLFERLLDEGIEDPAVRFNLAWSRAMLKDFDGALALLDADLSGRLPQAAMLEIQLLHEKGVFETAGERARAYIALHPDHRGLMAAVSVLALDIEDEALAAQCAAKAGDHPDALATLGTLALGEDRATEARAMFDRALERNEKVPRAWVGRGLAKMLTGEAGSAGPDIDRGAEMFGDHLGSWIAAGWAYFVDRDMQTSRARFETALALDPNFAESHGSLAVLDVLEGHGEQARHRAEIALRLDRHCYSAALAKVLLLAAAGDQAGAQRIFDMAISTPIDAQGRTIAQALARIGMTAGGSA